MRRLAATLALVAAVAAVLAPPTRAANPQIAGIQVALRAHGLYLGPIDGIAGPATRGAVVAFQRKKGLRVDGLAGIRTRVALGPLGRPLLGRRTLTPGAFGLDVSVLQFLLTRQGLYDGALDGYFGPETAVSLKKYQRKTGLLPDAVVGPRTLSSFTRRAALPAAAPQRTHTVRAGDTLAAIAARHRTTVAAVAKLNGIRNPNVVPLGARLELPPPSLPAQAAAATPADTVRTLLDHWAGRYGVDRSLVRALAWMESGFQTHLTSSAGAWGVMQILPSTWEFGEQVLIGRKVPRTPEGNIQIGVAYLHHLLRQFRGDERLALAGWYQGAAAVKKHGLYKVSEQFVANVLALRSRGV
jgi:LysM repeat protein